MIKGIQTLTPLNILVPYMTRNDRDRSSSISGTATHPAFYALKFIFDIPENWEL
jgi:hypothetical protein